MPAGLRTLRAAKEYGLPLSVGQGRCNSISTRAGRARAFLLSEPEKLQAAKHVSACVVICTSTAAGSVW
eukprot:6622294-Pyramimonas_sp.AAC.1